MSLSPGTTPKARSILRRSLPLKIALAISLITLLLITASFWMVIYLLGQDFNDLLPLPYTSETLDLVCNHVDEVQDVLARRILIENPSTYLTFDTDAMSESDFLAALARRTGCGLLLDVNNVFVSAHNNGFDPLDYIESFPLHRIEEIHLAGHAEASDGASGSLLIDTHDRDACD